MKKVLLSILILSLSTSVVLGVTTTNSYDKYGRKTGSYKTYSNGVTNSYDKYGRKTGSYKQDSSGRIIQYDKYGRKVGSYR